MLKISVIDGVRRRRLMVEGKLIAPWVAELKSACENARTDLRDRELVLEMKHVTYISQEGENVLGELISQGVKFRCYDVFTKHVLRRLTRKVRRSLQ